MKTGTSELLSSMHKRCMVRGGGLCAEQHAAHSVIRERLRIGIYQSCDAATPVGPGGLMRMEASSERF